MALSLLLNALPIIIIAIIVECSGVDFRGL